MSLVVFRERKLFNLPVCSDKSKTCPTFGSHGLQYDEWRRFAQLSFTSNHMEPAPLEILYEDNHCLAIAKPSGVCSAHFQGEEETLDRSVKQYLKQKYNKPGKVFLG